MVWVALELNIISFIPLISSSGWLQEREAALKYLLFQAAGSRILLLGRINQLISTPILLGLRLKLGIAPFHF
jgi:NADH:ubiquinone oxidoreductase subunit 2 (subunit N)